MLLLGQKLESCRDTLQTLKVRQALIVGLFQAIAPFPGVSRSGSTIAGGLLSGLTRDTAAQFSFLIAVPAIGGATLVYAAKLLKSGTTQYAPSSLIAGTIVSFVVGVLALRWLIAVISRRRLHWFAYYCLVVGLATIAWQLVDPSPAHTGSAAPTAAAERS
jgi:undecaprenyl-diphosphatase